MGRALHGGAICAVSILVLLLGAGPVAKAGQLTVGAASRVITPADPVGVYLAGFGQNRQATGVHDDIFARAFIIGDGTTRLVFIGLDLIGMLPDRIDQIRNTLGEHGFNPDHVVVACTHNHEAPDTLGIWGPNPFETGIDPEYQEFVVAQAVGAALDAEAASAPARMRIGTGPTQGLVHDSREPYVMDEEITTIYAESLEGTPLGTLVHWACHPEALGSQNTLITADYCASLYTTMESELGGTCVFLNGAIGGLISVEVSEHTFEEAERFGNDVAAFAMAALGGTDWIQDLELRVVTRRIPAVNRNPLYSLAIHAGLLEITPDEMVDGVGIGVTLLAAEIAGNYLVTYPGEMFPEGGRPIRTRLPEPNRFTIGLGNAEFGYMMPPELYEYPSTPVDPGEHYEETNSMGWDVQARVVAALHELLDELGVARVGEDAPAPAPDSLSAMVRRR
jgi:hypothetical protein